MLKEDFSNEFERRLEVYTNGSVKMVTPYVNKRTKVTIECNTCNYQWEITPEILCPSRMKRSKFNGCPNCKYVELQCPVCGKTFKKLKSKLTRDNYCSKECSAAGRNKYTINIVDSTAYRRNAFLTYEHKCSVCGWDKDERVLEVHHLDENRSNNNISNLIILCPTCHKFLTLHLYTYEELKTLNLNK